MCLLVINMLVCICHNSLICVHLCRHPEVGGDDKDPWTEIIAKLECTLQVDNC